MTSDSSKEEPEMFISCSVYLTVCSFLKDRKGKHKQQNKKLHRYIVLSSVCYTEHCLWPPPSWVTQHHPESLHAFSAFLGGEGVPAQINKTFYVSPSEIPSNTGKETKRRWEKKSDWFWYAEFKTCSWSSQLTHYQLEIILRSLTQQPQKSGSHTGPWQRGLYSWGG